MNIEIMGLREKFEGRPRLLLVEGWERNVFTTAKCPERDEITHSIIYERKFIHYVSGVQSSLGF